jgi:hypothetical protein
MKSARCAAVRGAAAVASPPGERVRENHLFP